MKNDAERQGRRYWIVTEINQATAAHPATVTATMRHASRKTVWIETASTEEAAVAKVLRYLRDDLRPFVKVNPGAP